MPGGRPDALTPEKQERLCTAIRAGNYYQAACNYAGVHYASFRRWMAKGKKAKQGRFRSFCEAIRKAEADAEVTIVAQWRQQIPENWQAARDFLGRRFPERWGPKEKHDLHHSGGIALEVAEEIVDAPDDATAADPPQDGPAAPSAS